MELALLTPAQIDDLEQRIWSNGEYTMDEIASLIFTVRALRLVREDRGNGKDS